jgi:hypothetical protein
VGPKQGFHTLAERCVADTGLFQEFGPIGDRHFQGEVE